MKKNLSDYLVALSVIICSAVLLGALTFALSGYRLKKPTRTLQINYEDVTGIKVHSEVRYAGAPAGRVIAMRHLTAAERAKSKNKKDAVVVTVELDENIPPLPADVTAMLSSDTLLAPKFVALSAGTPGGKTLANNSEVFYQMTEFFYPELADGVRWNDPAFSIAWPIPEPILSERDNSYPLFRS